jgi:hypothetical protein
MFNYKKVAYLVLGITTIISSVLLISASAGAAPNTSKMSLSAVLAQTFHLNQSSVQATIQQYNKTHHHKKPNSYTNHLAAEVKKGKITTTQEQAIITEHNQLVKEVAGLKNDAPSQKKVALKTDRTSAKTWAKANNIPVGLLYAHHHKKGHGHK